MELFHVLNKGVDGRILFKDSGDYVRFIHNMYEFNDANPAPQSNRRSGDIADNTIKEREILVDVHAWVLMHNHYHLLLSERKEGGISLFMRKLNVGYANYFNERYHRSGTLFQGRTKKIQIETDAYFLYILHYIHLNPLDYLEGAQEWRVRDASKTSGVEFSQLQKYLHQYRWSSYQDYLGKKNFPSILTTTLFQEKLGDVQKSTEKYLQGISDARTAIPSKLFLE
jgi:putative transposase